MVKEKWLTEYAKDVCWHVPDRLSCIFFLYIMFPYITVCQHLINNVNIQSWKFLKHQSFLRETVNESITVSLSSSYWIISYVMKSLSLHDAASQQDVTTNRETKLCNIIIWACRWVLLNLCVPRLHQCSCCGSKSITAGRAVQTPADKRAQDVSRHKEMLLLHNHHQTWPGLNFK